MVATMRHCFLISYTVSLCAVAIPAWSQQEGGISTAGKPVLRVSKDNATGQYLISDEGRPVLQYNYQSVEPGEILKQVQAGNLKYARPRSDYIHPLYGLDGEVLTKDWSVEHPHHRGIYWAWPEVDNGAERGDLHALQRVFARPAGKCATRDGVDCAQLEAENIWMWEDKEPIVNERAIIRAFRLNEQGRIIDLTFYFTALKDGITIARRGMAHYGGLNIRLAAVKDQQIVFHTDPPEANPRMAWGKLWGLFEGGKAATELTVFQTRANPCYPGEWIQYPNLNWLQPTFPANGTRYPLEKGEPLTLRFRLWIHRSGEATEETYREQWKTFDVLSAAQKPQ